MFASRTNWRLEPNRFTRALEEHRRSGRPLLDLTVSNPTVCGLRYPEAEILAALSDSGALAYSPESKGLRSAREAVAAYYLGRAGFSGAARHLDPDYLLLTSGTSEGYSHIFRLLCEPGDEVLVPAPSYPLLEFLADLADIRLVPYSLLYDHGWQMDLAVLRSLLTARSRAVMVVHPNNPTGSFVKAAEAEALAEICASREMAIVADEVFLDYGAAGGPAPSFVFETSALTFTLSGLSKVALMPQMKLAWVATSGPEVLARQAMERLDVIADTYLSPGVPVQLALPKLLSVRDDLQAQVRRRIGANLACLDRLLAFEGRVTRLHCEGGWYAILRVPVVASDEDMAIALLERSSVLVHPGHFFNFARDGFLVLSLITPESEFREGIRRIHKLLHEEAAP